MSHSVPTEKTNIPSSSALWAVLIFIGLIIAAVNFVQAENKDEGHGEHAAVEHAEHTGAPAHEAATEGHAAETPAATEHAAVTPVTDSNKTTGEAKPATEEAHH